MHQSEKNSRTVEVSEKEYKLLEIIRELDYGEFHVYISEKESLGIEEIRKSIKL